jgi:hypothetical protein
VGHVDAQIAEWGMECVEGGKEALGPGCGDATSKDCQQGSCPIHSGVGCTGLITNLQGERHKIASLSEGESVTGRGRARRSDRNHSRAGGGGSGASRGRGAGLGKEMAIEQDDRRRK